MTRAEIVIRPEFGPNDEVKALKRKFADLYSEVIGLTSWADTNEKAIESNRLAQKALDALEDAAMYAVKAATV